MTLYHRIASTSLNGTLVVRPIVIIGLLICIYPIQDMHVIVLRVLRIVPDSILENSMLGRRRI
jgi:hypothetical protein